MLKCHFSIHKTTFCDRKPMLYDCKTIIHFYGYLRQGLDCIDSSAKQKKIFSFCFSLAYKIKSSRLAKKTSFLCSLFLRFFVPLTLVEGTHVRIIANKFAFSLA